jgi:hypothetical protein
LPRFLIVLSLALVAPAAAQTPTTPAIAKQLLSGLADDSMQGRATGTPGAWRAARMIAREMRRIGLEPLGDSGYYQRVPISGDSAMVRGLWRDSLRLRTSFAELDKLPRARHRPAANLLGMIRGADPELRDEVVLIDAHYDHLGMRRPSAGGDSIYNGADDDASGVTAVLEIARQLGTGPKPKRTVIFAATIGEEAGLLGTRWFIEHPPIPLAGMVANLEIEMIARPDSLAGGPGRAWLTGYERSTLGETLAAAGIPIVPDKRTDEHFFERSDNIAFARRGIVAHTLSTFNLHADYHEVSDEVSKADFVHMAGVINAAAKAARILADGKKPVWKAGGRP